MAFSDEIVKKIIIEGDIKSLVDTAHELGSALSRQLTTSQIRNIFGEVRRIDLNWPEYEEDTVSETIAKLSETERRERRKKAQQAYRQLVLLRPKLAYQARRERGRGVEQLKEILDPCLVKIQDAASEKDRKLYFTRFLDFFEAILAYHRAEGGN